MTGRIPRSVPRGRQPVPLQPATATGILRDHAETPGGTSTRRQPSGSEEMDRWQSSDRARCTKSGKTDWNL